MTTQSWDVFDRLASITDRYGQTLAYLYDANGNRTRLTDPAGGATVYTYDALNRLASVTPAGQGPTVYSWKKNSLPESVAYPNGAVSTSSYDLANRVASITNTLGTIAVSSFVYSHDANGNRIEQVETQSGTAETTTYVYDAADRLETVSYPDQDVAYVYDAVGNRLRETATAAAGIPTPGEPLVDRTLSYNDRHQLLSVTDALDPAQSVVYTWNANGNQTSRTRVGPGGAKALAFLYDHRDRMEEVQKDGLLRKRYVYDHRGLRVRKSGPAGVEQTTYDDASAFWRTDGQGLRTATYHWGADRLLSLDSVSPDGATEGIAYYLQDALGSPTNLLGADGTLKARHQYDAWGNPRGTTTFNDLDNPFAFTGYESDEPTGLLYAKARYYDPTAGRFLTQDPFAGNPSTPPSLHKYLYAHANPTVYVDPTGRIAVLTRLQEKIGEGVEATKELLREYGDSSFSKSRAGSNLNVAVGVAGAGLLLSERFAEEVVGLTNAVINGGILTLTSDGRLAEEAAGEIEEMIQGLKQSVAWVVENREEA